MNSRSFGFVSSLFLAAALAFSVLGTACAEHHYYRVYDPYYRDYHVWDRDEVILQSVARENHRDPNRDFRKLPKGADRKEAIFWTAAMIGGVVLARAVAGPATF